MKAFCLQFRVVALMVERRIPNPKVEGSSPSYPAKIRKIMDKLVGYVKMSKLELAKVIFSLKQQVKNAFLTVALVVTVVTLFLALIDALMSFSISTVLGS